MELLLGYIDPGSGSLILQAVIAAAVAIPFFFRTRIAQAVRQVRRLTGRETSETSGTDDRAGR